MNASLVLLLRVGSTEREGAPELKYKTVCYLLETPHHSIVASAYTVQFSSQHKLFVNRIDTCAHVIIH